MENQKIHSVYILYSLTLKKHYVGSTSMSVEARLRKHLSNHNGFTAKAKDWEIVKQLVYNSKQDALQKERQIKKRGIRRWLSEDA